MTLGEATELTKHGKAAARKTWDNAFIYYVPANSYPAATVIAKKIWGDDLVPYNAYFAKKEQNNTVSIWFPTAEDLLAEDWVEVVL